jgi:hypothetical protein
MKKHHFLFEKSLFSLLVILSLNSCYLFKPKVITNTVHDSILVEKEKLITKTDTVTKTVYQEVNIGLLNPCDSLGKLKDGIIAELKQGKNSFKLYSSKGQLQLQAYQDSLTEYKSMLNSVNNSNKVTSVDKSSVQIIEKQLSLIDKIVTLTPIKWLFLLTLIYSVISWMKKLRTILSKIP